jgi:enterobactin synthetase component D
LNDVIEQGHGLRSIEPWPLTAPDGAPVPAWLICYTLADFDPLAFDAWGIACPVQVQRSALKRRAEFLFGRVAARHVLRQFGCAGVEVGTGSHRQPLWPPGIAGSITHSRGYAAAQAASQAKFVAVGLDIEGIAQGGALDALLGTAIDETELHRLQAAWPLHPVPTLVTLVFSAKEAFFKAAFGQVGRYFDFDAVKLRDVDGGASKLVFEVRQALAGGLMPGAIVEVRFGFLDANTVFTNCLW